MVPNGPGLLTNADATTKRYLKIRNFWKAEVNTFFMSSFLFYIPKYTLVIRFRHLDDISFFFGNSDLKVQFFCSHQEYTGKG